MLHDFIKCGYELLDGWGFHSEKTQKEYLKTQPTDKTMVCLMAAVLNELVKLRKHAKASPPLQYADEGDPVADGMLRAIQRHNPVASEALTVPFHGLTVRARRTLALAGIERIEDITRERIESIRGCGVTTVNELMRYKEMNMPAQTDEPAEPICEVDPIVGPTLPKTFDPIPEGTLEQ
jgi:hypothetical protein